MVIVCFSYNAPPQNDPEAFCTARFLSALAAKGIHVHLVTMDHEPSIDPALTAFFLDRRVRVTRIPIESPRRIVNLINGFRYRFHGPLAHQLAQCISTLKSVLRDYENPILLTRSYPVISNIVGYYCRHHAAHWFAHFGDPYPGFGMYSRRDFWKHHADLWWSKIIFQRASAVTVTCRNAVKWFSEILNTDVSTKTAVVTHIGFPHLTQGTNTYADSREVRFAHVGFWSERRYLQSVLAEFGAANALNPHILLEQHGPMDTGWLEETMSTNSSYLRVHSNRPMSPKIASAILGESDINVVIDQNDNLAYCPYLASKFAYSVASGRPVLAIGQSDSEMAKLHAEFGGFYFSDIRSSGDLRDILLSIASTPRDHWSYPSAALMNAFSPDEVASKFLLRVEKVLGHDKAPCREAITRTN
jgi:hypothetical protein